MCWNNLYPLAYKLLPDLVSAHCLTFTSWPSSPGWLCASVMVTFFLFHGCAKPGGLWTFGLALCSSACMLFSRSLHGWKCHLETSPNFSVENHQVHSSNFSNMLLCFSFPHVLIIAWNFLAHLFNNLQFMSFHWKVSFLTLLMITCLVPRKGWHMWGTQQTFIGWMNKCDLYCKFQINIRKIRGRHSIFVFNLKLRIQWSWIDLMWNSSK